MREMPYHKQVCEAMQRAQIDNPDSQKGKDFCVEHCPYDKCIVFEESEAYYPRSKHTSQKRIRQVVSWLRRKGYTAKDISEIMSLPRRKVYRYLEGIKSGHLGKPLQ